MTRWNARRNALSKEILTGDSIECQVPGGFGAAGAPCDGMHQYLHLLNKAFCTVAVSWGQSIDLRKHLDQLNVSVQGSISTKHLDCTNGYIHIYTTQISVCTYIYICSPKVFIYVDIYIYIYIYI